MTLFERQLEEELISKLSELQYVHRDDISLYEPVDMMDKNKTIFKKVLSDFRRSFPFNAALLDSPNTDAEAE
jgi:hypothetical protein